MTLGVGEKARQLTFRLAGQSALYGLAGALGKAVALITVPILSRLLSPAEYGLADLANSLAAVLAMLAMFGGDIPAARLLGQAPSASKRLSVLGTYVWTTCTIGVLIALVLLPFAGLISADVWSAPGRQPIALLSIALIPISAAQASLVTTQRLQGRPVAFAALATVDLLAQMLLAVLFAAMGGGATGLVAGFVLGSLIGLAAAGYQARGLILARPMIRLGIAMLREGGAFLPAALAFVVAEYAVRFLLVDSQGQDAVGLFAVAVRLAGGMALATGAFSMAWGPYGLALADTVDTARLFGRVMRQFALVASLGALTLGALGPELITVVSGSQYGAGAEILPGLLVAAAMSGGFYILLVAAGVRQRGPAVGMAATVGAVVEVAATALLLPPLGLQAVGSGAVLGQACALIILVSAVGPSVLGGRSAVAVLCLAGGIAIWIQALNVNPGEWLAPRVAFALVAAAFAGWLMLRVVRHGILAGADPTS